MGAATEGAEIVRLSREHAELKPVADAVQGLARARAAARPDEGQTRPDPAAWVSSLGSGAENDTMLRFAPSAANSIDLTEANSSGVSQLLLGRRTRLSTLLPAGPVLDAAHEVSLGLRAKVRELAEERGIPVRTPKSLRTAEAQADFDALGLDCAVVAAYGLILPQPILDAPRLGCLNIHASLLPRWRGAAPIHRALLAGDAETGVTIMRMDAGLDTGPMLLKGTVPITERTTAVELHDALAVLGACMVVTGVGTQTLLQLSVAGAMRGRVLSLYGIIFRGGPAVGALIMGLASEHAGLRLPLAVGSLLAMLAWLWTWSARARITRALEAAGHAD